jgi:type IV pilus assembly protein PilF
MERDPRLASAWAVRASIVLDQGDVAAAEADLRTASENGAALPWAELLLARLLLERGAEDEARPHLEAVIDLAPESGAADEARKLLAAG